MLKSALTLLPTPHLISQRILSALSKYVYRRRPPPTSPIAASLDHATTISCLCNNTRPSVVSGSHRHHPTVYFQPKVRVILLKHVSSHPPLVKTLRQLSSSSPDRDVTFPCSSLSCPLCLVSSSSSLTHSCLARPPWMHLALSCLLSLDLPGTPVPHYPHGCSPPPLLQGLYSDVVLLTRSSLSTLPKPAKHFPPHSFAGRGSEYATQKYAPWS